MNGARETSAAPSSACSVGARCGHRRRPRDGAARACRLASRLVDRCRRPLAQRPRADAAVRQTARRPHAGAPHRRCGFPAVTRCSTCTAHARHGGRRDHQRLTRAVRRRARRTGRRRGRRSRTASSSSTVGVRYGPASTVAVGHGCRRYDRRHRGTRRCVRRRGSRPGVTAAPVWWRPSSTRWRTGRRSRRGGTGEPRGLGAVEPVGLATRRRWHGVGRCNSTAGCGSSSPTTGCSVSSRRCAPRRCWRGKRGRSIRRSRRCWRTGVSTRRPPVRGHASAAGNEGDSGTGVPCRPRGRSPGPRGEDRCPVPRRGPCRFGARGRRRGSCCSKDWPREWIGLPIDVRDAPTRKGPVSCSVRWHADRPALLWDGPADVQFRGAGARSRLGVNRRAG